MSVWGRLKYLWLMYAVTMLLPALAANQSIDLATTPSYDDLKRNAVTGMELQLHDVSYEPIRSTILKNFDCRCLSNPLARVLISVFYSPIGVPVYKVIDAQNASAMDLFYCEQAIWENVVPPGPYNRELILEFLGQPDRLADARLPDSIYGEHPELLNAELIQNWQLSNLQDDHIAALRTLKGRDEHYVKLHLIPRRFPSCFFLPEGAISNSSNVLRLSIKNLDNPRLSQFRLDCRKIGASPASYKIILARAAELRKKYSDLFD